MKAPVKWALAAAAVLLVGLVSLQQTGALWRSKAPGASGTVTAGKLDISAGQLGMKTFTIDGLALANAAPGDSVQKPLPVINSGNVTMRYQLNSVAVSGSAPLALRAAVVPSEAACTATGDPGSELYSGPAQTAGFGPQTVAAGSTEVLCLRMTIASNAGFGKSSTATFTFGAESVPHS